ncbi:MarR family winged helix-turn-helix transcriptional regulator [Rhizobium halophytocola]|uniref:MarR family transcriptional regulator for hemolysin n=1 Tax=Rhizobium halophytocola TaxID=735519 RepID=A0ABS4E3S9_9HYPH|nr:MarR family transcriptional regulator [Rhizobium halophytocola]MBP1852601.1 MarR family transcriptional regulator for hemolysin [Rhizobium halophytocola]
MANASTLQRQFSATLLSTGRQWRKLVDQHLSSHGVSEASAAPLIFISRLGNGVRQVKLASTVGIEGPSLVRLLDQLEKQGLVIRKDDPEDRRAKGIWLTEEGERVANEVEKLVDELREHILRRVDRADVEAALRVMKAFEDADISELTAENPKG